MRAALRHSLRHARAAVASTGLLVLLAAVVGVAAGVAPGAPSAGAQEEDAQALTIERQLRCPQCTNLRLDACELQICEDMRQIIRQRLEAGDHPDEIVFYFTQRFGDRIRYDLARSGFNLWLFGWVGGSIALVAVVGGFMLLRLRRTADPAPASQTAADERWLDDQIHPNDRTEG